MRLTRFLPLTAALLVAVTAPAHAINWSLGANLGIAVNMPERVDDFTVFSWPANSLFETPGLRVGFLGDDPRHELYLDTGLLLISNGGSASNFVFTGNYQHNFVGSTSMSPYLTGGLGIVSRGESNGTDLGATSLMFGVGAGLRHRMGNRHGVLRAEIRLDHVTEGDDGPIILINESNILGIKLGFDLWDDPVR